LALGLKFYFVFLLIIDVNALTGFKRRVALVMVVVSAGRLLVLVESLILALVVMLSPGSWRGVVMQATSLLSVAPRASLKSLVARCFLVCSLESLFR